MNSTARAAKWWPYAGLRLVLALLLGASLTLAYAPFDYYWLTLPVLIGVLALGWDATAAEGFKLGFSFGLGWFSTGLSWIFVSIDQFGGLPLLATLFILALLYCYLALFPALAFMLWRYAAWWRRDPQQHQARQGAIFLLPLLWLLIELLRGWLFTGFPWLSLGYTQTTTMLGQWAPWVGEIGVSVLLMLLASAVLWAWFSRNWQALIPAALILLIAGVLPHFGSLSRTGVEHQVALVQGNVQQSTKWDAAQQWPTVLRYLDLSRPHYGSSDVIIWPESAITILEPFAGDILANIEAATQAQDTAIVTGIIDYRREADAFYNSIVVVGPQGEDQLGRYQYRGDNRYQKHQLLPIGEFVPFEAWLRPLAPLFNLPMSSFSRGDYQQANLQANGVALAAAICYEILFSAQVGAQLENQTDYILTISNDTWFGRSHGPWQHLQIAQMRALEYGRPVLRGTNSGITAVINEYGEIQQQLPQFERDVLVTAVAQVRGETFYREWGNLGAWLLGLIWLAVGAGAHYGARRNARS